MLEDLFIAIGYGLCHQLPERSFIAGGFQLPVCARDTGIYIGFAVGLAAVWALHRDERPTELPRWPVLALMGLFVAAMGIDGVTSYAGLRETTNDIRLVTGLLTGWALSGIVVPMINAQLWSWAGQGRVLSSVRTVVLWLMMLGGTYGVSRWLLPLTGVAYPLLVAFAILLTFEAVNLVFVGLLPPFERRAERMRDARVQLLLAFLLTLAELGAAAWLRVITVSLLT